MPGKPGDVERLDRIDPRHEPSDRLVPASDHQMNFRLGRSRAHGFEGAKGHQEITDALETEQQNPLWSCVPDTGARRQTCQAGVQQEVGAADQGALSRFVDLQMIEHLSRHFDDPDERTPRLLGRIDEECRQDNQ